MENKEVRNKRILLFAPAFFDYYKEIERCLKKNSNTVVTILENFADESILYRCVWSKNEWTRKMYTNSYYEKILSKVEKNFDIVLVIRGEALTPKIMQLVKKNSPSAKFVMYQWDSVKNNPNALKIKSYFQKIYTFDSCDAGELGWKYRPLFYCGLEQKNCLLDKKIYKFAYIGTLYYKRAELYKKIIEFCKKNKYNIYDYLYTPKIVFYIHKYLLRDKRYSIVTSREVKFKALKTQELKKIYCKTDILVDYTAESQTGLTMRTIESIGYKCKLITNNKKIVDTDVYKYGNIFVYDIENFFVPKKFLEKEYTELPRDVYESYSINKWIEDVLGDENA